VIKPAAAESQGMETRAILRESPLPLGQENPRFSKNDAHSGIFSHESRSSEKSIVISLSESVY
jgi:hypothetical protein